jgi:hypothetical protein
MNDRGNTGNKVASRHRDYPIEIRPTVFCDTPGAVSWCTVVCRNRDQRELSNGKHPGFFVLNEDVWSCVLTPRPH